MQRPGRERQLLSAGLGRGSAATRGRGVPTLAASPFDGESVSSISAHHGEGFVKFCDEVATTTGRARDAMVLRAVHRDDQSANDDGVNVLGVVHGDPHIDLKALSRGDTVIAVHIHISKVAVCHPTG